MKRICLFTIALIALASSYSFGQKTVQTIYKKHRLDWNTKPFELEVVDPKTGLSKLKMVDERTTLNAWDNQKVTLDAPKTIVKSVEKHISKSMSKMKVKRPTFNGRDVKIHFQNYVVDTSGNLVYHEVLIFPYRQSVQLYQNEYTPEIKTYLKAVQECVDSMPNLGPQKQPIYIQEVLEL